MAKIELTTTRPKKQAKTADPAPTAEPTPTPAPTVEELDARRKGMIETMGWSGLVQPDKPAEKAEGDVPPPEPSPEPEPAPAPAPAPAKPTVEPAPAPTPEPSPTMATKDDIEAAAKRAAQLVADQRPAAAPTPKPVVAASFELSPQDQKDLDVIRFLERTDPDKHRGRTDKFIAYTRDYYAYQDAWAAKPENEGKDFNPDDPEHNGWFEKHEAGTTESEIESGREKLVEERVYLNRVKPELDKIERENAINQAIPKVIASVGQRTLQMIQEVNPELAKLLQDAQGNPVFSAETLKAVDEADPVARKALDAVVKNELEPMLVALEMTTIPNANYQFNPATNAHHAKIAEHIRQAEQDMLNASAEVRIQNGKEFATISQYEQMRASILNGNATDKERELANLDQRYYTLTVDDVEALIVSDVAEKARKAIDEMDNLAKRKYGGAKQNGGPAPTHEPAQPAPTPPQRSMKPNPPSSRGAGEIAPTGDQPGQTVKKFGETMAGVMFK